jgi:guanosine-3',5'-bis(diphosphate) 3'-pyrophosphohydrolase
MARYEAGMADPEVLMAAVLHDVVEDSDATLEKIEEKFGERVASLVGEMTRKEPAPEQTRSMTYEEIWELRNKWMLEEIRAMSPEAQIIKLCDRISNITDGMTTKSPTILARYVKQTEQILHIIPRETHPKLWDKLTALAEEAKRLTV